MAGGHLGDRTGTLQPGREVGWTGWRGAAHAQVLNEQCYPGNGDLFSFGNRHRMLASLTRGSMVGGLRAVRAGLAAPDHWLDGSARGFTYPLCVVLPMQRAADAASMVVRDPHRRCVAAWLRAGGGILLAISRVASRGVLRVSKTSDGGIRRHLGGGDDAGLVWSGCHGR